MSKLDENGALVATVGVGRGPKGAALRRSLDLGHELFWRQRDLAWRSPTGAC
ncbi:MAG: hypothetical protein MZW92_36935 [Comamonadaceae bacterium]|nr:hypothetical protein [Comamonadaceae bacterium]